jgi:hypothetical protein
MIHFLIDLTTLISNRTSRALKNAFFRNSRADLPESFLVPVPHQDTGLEPPFFPQTLGEFQTLSGAQVNELLSFYGLPILNQTVLLRRSMLGNFLHLRTARG